MGSERNWSRVKDGGGGAHGQIQAVVKAQGMDELVERGHK